MVNFSFLPLGSLVDGTVKLHINLRNITDFLSLAVLLNAGISLHRLWLPFLLLLYLGMGSDPGELDTDFLCPEIS